MATDIKKIIKEYFSAINAHDVNKIVSFWAMMVFERMYLRELSVLAKMKSKPFIPQCLLTFPTLKVS